MYMTPLLSVITALTFFIMPAPTTLYDATMTAVVDLPAGYFVLQNDTNAPEGYISVVYDDLSGYVKSTSVDAVDYTPVTKYEKTVTFSCDNDGQPVNLRAAPRKNAEIISTLDRDASGRCYGSIDGDVLIKDAGNTWYYVSCNGLRGYCYYAHVSVTPTPPNIIEKEQPVVADPTPPEQPDDPPEQKQTMSSTAAIIFIVALCIPVPFIMFFLFKKPKDE